MHDAYAVALLVGIAIEITLRVHDWRTRPRHNGPIQPLFDSIDAEKRRADAERDRANHMQRRWGALVWRMRAYKAVAKKYRRALARRAAKESPDGR